MKMSNIGKYPQTGVNKNINVEGLSILLAPLPLQKSKTLSPTRKEIQGSNGPCSGSKCPAPSAPCPGSTDKSSVVTGICPGSILGITCTGPSMCPASSPVSRTPGFRKNERETDVIDAPFATSTPNSSQTAIFEKHGNLNELNSAFFSTATPESLSHKTKKHTEFTKQDNKMNTNATENILENKKNKNRCQCRSAPVKSKARSQGASTAIKTLE